MLGTLSSLLLLLRYPGSGVCVKGLRMLYEDLGAQLFLYTTFGIFSKTVFCNARRECCMGKRARWEKYYSVPPWYSNGNVSRLLRILRVFATRSRTIIGRLIGS